MSKNTITQIITGSAAGMVSGYIAAIVIVSLFGGAA